MFSNFTQSANIPAQQRIELLDRYGVYATSACDRCGKILGPVRFTKKDDPGEWCSRVCRGGVEHEITYGKCSGCGVSLAGGRKRRLYCGDACRKRPRRKINPESHIQNKGLVGVFSTPLDYPLNLPFSEQEPGPTA